MNKSMYKEYNFTSKENFQGEILSIDSFVPKRSKGRKTEHTEKYTIMEIIK